MSSVKKYRLKGHEKFLLREGWLAKGVYGIKENPKLFTSNNAPDILGVGNNMVKSIRYWLQAFGIVDDNQRTGMSLNELGTIISNNDIYLENNYTLWVLHYMLTQNYENATSWFLFYNKCDVIEFNKEEINSLMKKELISYLGKDDFSMNSLKDDIDMILNMYSKEKAGGDPEDKNICPFSSLGLIKKSENKYIRTQPDIRRIDSKVLLFIISMNIEKDNSISIDTLTKIAHMTMNLNRVGVNYLLDILDNDGFIVVNRTAGLDVVYMNETVTPKSVCELYYQNC